MQHPRLVLHPTLPPSPTPASAVVQQCPFLHLPAQQMTLLYHRCRSILARRPMRPPPSRPGQRHRTMPRATSLTSRTWSSTRSYLSPLCRQTRRRCFRRTISNSVIAQTRDTDSRRSTCPAHPSSHTLTRIHRTISYCRPTSHMSSSSSSDMSAIFLANYSIHIITLILHLTR